MGRKLTIKSGNTTIELPAGLNDTFLAVVNKLIPESKKAIIKALDEIEEEAKEDWPVRQSKRSKNSKRKIYTEVFLDTNQNLVARVGNDAEYAWAIKVGAKSETSLPYGKRVANELLFKPMKKQSNKIVKILANETAKLAKKGK